MRPSFEFLANPSKIGNKNNVAMRFTDHEARDNAVETDVVVVAVPRMHLFFASVKRSR